MIEECTSNTLFTIPYGSIIYGTYNEKSDIDLLKIVKTNSNPDEHIYTPEEYQAALVKHEVVPVETFSYACNRFNNFPFLFHLDKWDLRQSFSEVASNSWVKCKKKLKDGEIYIGLKSLFHSLRILRYGCDIARNKFITCFNTFERSLYQDIMFHKDKDWDFFYDRYKRTYNKISSELRELCPKS